MRIWSLHPENLDTKGLLALWRETLLAKHVLEGNTKGYKNHPQLTRFKLAEKPPDAINFYLSVVCDEATRRGYRFDSSKFTPVADIVLIPVTTGQIAYETEHLLRKLQLRDKQKFSQVSAERRLKIHPLFRIIEGGLESWEKV